jgi:hypothetical protein
VSPIYDPDQLKPHPLDMSESEALLRGLGTIKDARFLREWGERMAEEIRGSGQRDEIEKAYKKRMRELSK